MSSELPPNELTRPELPSQAPPPAPLVPQRPTPDPSRTLAPAARTYWSITAMGQVLPLLLLLALFGSSLAGRAPDLVLGALAIVLPLGILVHVLVIPRLRWRRWRYEVREQEIDLQRGAFVVRRTLVPMSRVQHVDTRRTVVSEMFGLASVVFHTAAGANEIPALGEAEAAEIRDRIADLAATADDPV